MSKALKVFFILIFLTLTPLLFFRNSLAHTNSRESEHVIHMTQDGFSPKELEIEAGETVIFENLGDEQHWPASNIHPSHRIYPGSDIKLCGTKEEGLIFDACGEVKPNDSYSFTFESAGTWKYHDHLNPGLSGEVVVKGVVESETVATDASFSQKILNFLKNIKTKLLSILSFEDENVLGSVEREYDESIEQDSTDIFSDFDALYSYVKKFGPKSTTKRLHELQSNHGDCHNVAHEAGRYAYEIFEGKAFRECSAECHSGCYHGATEAYFRDRGTTKLADDLKLICSSELNSFFSHQCIHGIGHGLMAWSDYEIHEALSTCDLLPSQRASCYSGVFMENIIGGLAPEVGHSTEFLSDDPHFPCDEVDEKYKNACYFYQSSRMVQVFAGDFAKVAGACGEVDSIYQTPCFESMGRDVGGTNRGSPLGAIETCSVIESDTNRTACLRGAVQDYFWDPSGADNAVELCTALTDESEKEACYLTIFPRATNVLSSDDSLKKFCSKVEDHYRERCMDLIQG